MLGSAVSPGRVTPGWPGLALCPHSSEELGSFGLSEAARTGSVWEPQEAEELWLLGLALSLLSYSVPLSLLQLPWGLGSPLALGQCWKCFSGAAPSLLGAAPVPCRVWNSFSGIIAPLPAVFPRIQQIFT